MMLSKAVLVLFTVGTLAISAPAFAASRNQSTGREGAGGGQNPLSSDRGNDMGADVYPNFSTGCFRRDLAGQDIVVACPVGPTTQQSQRFHRY